jgi:hypothetical protein
MIKIPSIIYSNTDDFIFEITELVQNKLFLADDLIAIAQRPDSNIKHTLEKLNKTSAMQLIIICLAYTQIDSLEIRVEPFGSRLKENLKKISEGLHINAESILPISTIENDLIKTLSKVS